LEAIQAALLASQEYFMGHGDGTASSWIGSLYQDALHRTPGQSEVNFWLGVLTQ
jgi:hypothetical protein